MLFTVFYPLAVLLKDFGYSLGAGEGCELTLLKVPRSSEFRQVSAAVLHSEARSMHFWTSEWISSRVKVQEWGLERVMGDGEKEVVDEGVMGRSRRQEEILDSIDVHFEIHSCF